MFCRSLFFLLSFFFWPLWCLSFDLRILITPFVSSTSSNYVHDGYHYSCVWISLSLFPLSRYPLVIRLKKIYNVFMHFSSYCIYIMFSWFFRPVAVFNTQKQMWGFFRRLNSLVIRLRTKYKVWIYSMHTPPPLSPHCSTYIDVAWKLIIVPYHVLRWPCIRYNI